MAKENRVRSVSGSRSRSPCLDMAVFSRCEYDLFVIKEAKRSHNLSTMGSWQVDAVVAVEHPLALGRTSEINEFK